MFLDTTSSAILALACILALIFLARGTKRGSGAEMPPAAPGLTPEQKAQTDRVEAVWEEVKGLVGVYLAIPPTLVSREFESPLDKFAYDAGIVYYIAQQKLPKSEAGLLIARYAADTCGAEARKVFTHFEAMDPALRGKLMRMSVDDLGRAMDAAKAMGETTEQKS